MISLLLGASAAFVAPLASRSAISRGGAVQMAGDGTVVKNAAGYDQDGLFNDLNIGGGKKPPLKILSRVEELRILSTLADTGLLSKAEADGVFTKLEKGKAFSKIEKLLPLADDLKLLSTAEGLLNQDSSSLFIAGVALLVGEAGLIYVVPDDNTALVAVQAVTGLAAGVGGIALLGVSSFFSLLQGSD